MIEALVDWLRQHGETCTVYRGTMDSIELPERGLAIRNYGERIVIVQYLAGDNLKYYGAPMAYYWWCDPAFQDRLLEAITHG